MSNNYPDGSTVKVHFVDSDWYTIETRRFAVRGDVIFNYSMLREKLQFLFPNLHDSFSISWIDADDDYILISSNEELAIAVNEIKSTPMVLYVQAREEQHHHHHHKEKKRYYKKVSHTGVVCDGCNRAILGFRYKCVQCADYDLCSTCEHKKLHDFHFMIRMPHSINWKSESGHALIAYLVKFVECNSTTFMENGEKPFWADILKNVFSKFSPQCPMNQFYDEEKNQTNDNAQSSTNHATQEGKFCKELSINLEELMPKLQNILYGLSMDAATEKCPAQNSSTPAEDTAKKFPGEGKKLTDNTDDKAAMSDSNSNTEVHSSHEESPTRTAMAEDWTIVDKETPTISHASSVPVLNETDVQQAQSTTPEASAPIASAQSAPPAPTISVQPAQSSPIVPAEKSPKQEVDSKPKEKVQHSNPIIQDALEAMVSMGYTDKAGLLTFLLEAKNGNINEVLDLLQPTEQ